MSCSGNQIMAFPQTSTIQSVSTGKASE